MNLADVHSLIPSTKCSISIDATKFQTNQLISIVGMVGINEQKITIKNAQTKTNADLINIVGLYKDNVTLEFG